MLDLSMSVLGWFHTAACVVALVAGAGWLLARYKRPRGAWRYLHLTCMLLAYYDLLGGGGERGASAGEPAVRRLWRDGVQVIGMTHGVIMLGALALILIFLVATAVGQWRFQARAAQAFGAIP